jgi:hypothetical protein
LFYIGPDGCEPAMCLALETDNNEALTLMMDFGANCENGVVYDASA